MRKKSNVGHPTLHSSFPGRDLRRTAIGPFALVPLAPESTHAGRERENAAHVSSPPPPLTPAMAAVPPPDPAHLADLAAAGAALFQLDDDRAVCGRDYQINLQGVVHGYDGAVRDAAPGPLFALSPDLLRRYAPFVALLDNFTAQV